MNEPSFQRGDPGRDDGLQSPENTDADELVQACIRGDRHARGDLYHRYGDRIYGLMVRMVGRQDADDLTQQVFLQAFRKLEQFRGRSKLETWLYRLATNEALQHLRRQRRREIHSLAAEPAEEMVDHLVESEQHTLLQIALARLDPQLRVVLSLKEERGLSYREIAEAVGIPEGTVGSRLTRARKELRNELTKLGW